MQLKLEQAELLPVDLCVPPALMLDVPFDDVLVGILAHRVHVEATRPEVATPEDVLHLGVVLKDVLGGEAFDDLNDA